MIFMYKNKEGTIMMKKYWRKMMALTCAADVLKIFKKEIKKTSVRA